MKKLWILSSVVCLILSVSCSSDSDDDIVITEITYSKHISPIITANCTFCHGSTPSNGAPMSLTTLNEVKDAIQSRNLIGAIEGGFMPPNGSLTPEQIQLFKTWQADGFPQ